MNSPKPVVGRLSRRGGVTIAAVTGHCKLCPEPIRAGERTVWIRQPAMGRTHPGCVQTAIQAGLPVTVAAQ